MKIKVAPIKIILSSEENINNAVNKKYGINPNDFEKKSLSSKKVKKLFNVLRIERTKKYTINWIGMIEKKCRKKVKAARRS